MKKLLILSLLIISGTLFGQAPQIKLLPVARLNQIDQTARDSMDVLRVEYNSLLHRVDSILFAAAQTDPLIVTYSDAGYDSTYILSFTQKFAIPEDVEDSDVVGTWQKTFTWRSGNAVSYSIQTNHQGAFAINSSTGVITVSDATKINGKVVQQDTVIALVIKSTDAVLGYELDTAYVRVKENSYCRFIDYSYASTESGTRMQPYNDFGDVTWTAGYGYFVKRGNTPTDKGYSITGIANTATNPLVIGAYGTGNRPEFNGSGLTTTDGLFTFTTSPVIPQHYQIYDLDAKNYPERVLNVGSGAKYFGVYNMTYQDNYIDAWSQHLGEIYFNGSLGDSLNFKWHDIRNIESSGGYAPVIRSIATKLYAYNIKTDIVTSADGSTAPSASNHGWSVRTAPYNYFYHFVFTGNGRHVQNYYPHCTFQDGYVYESSNTGYLGQGSPNGLVLDNILFRRCGSGIYIFDSGHDNIRIKNCLFDRNTNGIYFNNSGNDVIVERCAFRENATYGMRIGASTSAGYGDDMIIRYCSFFDDGTSIYSSSVNGIINGVVHNLTANGTIDFTNSTTTTVRNCFYSTLSGTLTTSNNLDVDGITTGDYFQNYATGDYRLKSTATSAIDQGYTMSVTPDIAGTSVPQGSATDIGAYEYK